MNLIIVERADAGRSQPECFRREIQAVADGTCFKMHIAITSVAMGADNPLEVADRPCLTTLLNRIVPDTYSHRGRLLEKS
jgi:hypothetical protein